MAFHIKYRPFLLLLPVLLLASCASDELLPQEPVMGSTQLQLRVNTQEKAPNVKAIATQSQTAGIDSLHENLLQTLDIYLYAFKDGGSGGESSIKHIHLENIDTTLEYEVYQTISAAELRQLYPDGEGGTTAITPGPGVYCYAYAVANSPETLPDESTIYDIQKRILTTDRFASWTQPIQDNFVMDGENVIELSANGLTYALKGTIILRRAAAKLDLIIHNVQDTVVDDENRTWYPDINNMYVSYYNGVKRGNLNPDDLRESDKVTLTSEDFFHFGTIEEGKMRKLQKVLVYDEDGQVMKAADGVSDSINYQAAVPFYTYPHHWTHSTRSDSTEPYFSLIVPWKHRTWNSDIEDYEITTIVARYQIPARTYEPHLDRNCYYKTLIDVAVMGSLGETEKIELKNNTYIVLPWTSSTLIPIDMHEIQFLSVRDDSVTINNEPSGYTEYASSHDVTTRITRLEYMDYSEVTIHRWVYERYEQSTGVYAYRRLRYDNYSATPAQTTTITESAFNTQIAAFTPSAADGQLTLTNTLDLQNIYSPRIVTVEIENERALKEQTVFTIYPPIYIVGERSSGNVLVNGTNYAQASGGNHTVYDDNNGYLGSIVNPSTITGSTTNSNPVHYVVNTTALPSGSSYMLGDPRTTEINNLTNLSALTEYHPTLESGTENFISPSFLIASSYGVTNYNQMTLDLAIKRCASYQEDGYPAGRWRAPTAAEIIFMVYLSQQNIIPSLFLFDANDHTGYWSANGKVIGDSNGNPVLNTAYNNINTAVRCVYDIWYWGNEHATDTAAQSAIKGDDKTNEELINQNWVNAW